MISITEAIAGKYSSSFFLLCLLLLSACTYRFTNQSIEVPVGVKTIAIEAVYDTSREVLAHEYLWEAMQRAFAADGHLVVVAQGDADALVRMHLKSADELPAGTAETRNDARDIDKSAAVGAPASFRVLPEAGEFTTKQTIKMSVAVEIIDLHTRNTLFTNTYSDIREFRSFRSETSVAQRKSHFLLFDEARTVKVREISQGIADAVVRDFLVKR